MRSLFRLLTFGLGIIALALVLLLVFGEHQKGVSHPIGNRQILSHVTLEQEMMEGDAQPNPDKPNYAKIAVILGGMGQDYYQTLDAIKDFPAFVGLALTADVDHFGVYIKAAQMKKHDILLDVPMESSQEVKNQEAMGGILRNGLSKEENIKRLDDHLDSAKGISAVTTISGSGFEQQDTLKAIADDLQTKNMTFLDTYGYAQMAQARNGVFMPLDALIGPNENGIDARLEQVEKNAHDKGSATVLIVASPANLKVLKTWIDSFPNKKLLLVPFSDLKKTGLKS